MTLLQTTLALITWSIVFAFLLSGHAMAFSGCTTAVSLEDAYRSSSFVFSGVVEQRNAHDVSFKLTHVYKPPKQGLPSSPKVFVPVDFFTGPIGPIGSEWLVFGTATNVEGSNVTTVVPTTCGPSRLTSEEQLTQLRHKHENPSLFSKGDWPIIFTGRIKQLAKWPDSLSNIRHIKAVAEVELIEIFRDASPFGKPHLADISREHRTAFLSVSSCGDAYQLGHSYLIHAQPRALNNLSGYSGDSRSVTYTDQCPAAGLVDLNDKKILSALSKQQQQH